MICYVYTYQNYADHKCGMFAHTHTYILCYVYTYHNYADHNCGMFAHTHLYIMLCLHIPQLCRS